MNEELKNKLNEFLGKLIEGMQKAGDFAVDQIPDVVQQALTWFALKSGILFGLGVVLLFSMYFLFKFVRKHWYLKDENGDYILAYSWKEKKGNDAVQIMGTTTLTLGIIVGLLLVILNLQWLQILVAPKWFIVSEMSKIIS